MPLIRNTHDLAHGDSVRHLTYNYAATSGQNGSGSTAGNSGQLMSISGTINATTESAAYTYDNLGRLVTSDQTTNSVSAQRQFDYDRWGNRVAVWDTADKSPVQLQSVSLQQSGGAPTNRLTSVTNGSTTLNYSYDNNGNVLNDGVHAYQYDAKNRVVSVDNGATASYGYDQANQRIKKTIGASVTHCIWESSQVIAEHNGSTGAVITNYTYSGSRMIAKTTSGTTSYFLSDRLSARVTLDASGNVAGRQAHLPFGEDLNTSGTTDKHKMTSYERDSESANDYAHNRNYSPMSGRFNQADPYKPSGGQADPQSWNRYAYVQNNPVNYVDPSGLNLEAPDGVRYTCWITYGTGPVYVGNEWVGTGNVITSIGCSSKPVSDNPSSGGSSYPVEDALIYLAATSPGCTAFFGHERILQWATEGRDFALGTELSNELIPGVPGGWTYSRYWKEVVKAAVAAGVLLDGVYYKAIILGAAYYVPEMYARYYLDWYHGDVNAYQKSVLVHEFLHIKFQKTDVELANHFLLNLKGYEYTDLEGASRAIQEFLSRDCQEKKKKRYE